MTIRDHFATYRAAIDADLRERGVSESDVVWSSREPYDAVVSFNVRSGGAGLPGGGHIARITRDGAAWIAPYQPEEQGDDLAVKP